MMRRRAIVAAATAGGRSFGRKDAPGAVQPLHAVPKQLKTFGSRRPYVVQFAGAAEGGGDLRLARPGVQIAMAATVVAGLCGPLAAQSGSDAQIPAVAEIVDVEEAAPAIIPPNAAAGSLDVPAPAEIDDLRAGISPQAATETGTLDSTTTDAGVPITPDMPIGRQLHLEVFINDVSTGLIGSFWETPDGGLAAQAQELNDVGLKPSDAAADSNGLVRVDQLPEVVFHINEGEQRLYVQTNDAGRAAKVIDLASNNLDERMQPQTGLGAVLNYTLFAASNSFDAKDTDLFQGVSGDFDARVFSRFGTVSQSFLAGYNDGDLGGFTRLNTSWTYSDPNRLITYKGGDFISGGLAWTRPVYLGGFQAQRNFHLRSDLVTMPLPSFQGTAAVPSTLEIYTQNTRTYSGEIGEGPFEVSNLPAFSGSGEARVVLRDSLGRETTAELPFYASSMLLARGLLDFSMDVGFPRRNFGSDSFDYDERVYGVATARYGLSDRLTLEAHAEVGEDLLNAGLGAAFPLAHYGAASIAGAGSHSEGRTGSLVNATLELGNGNWSMYGRVQRAFGDYEDVASVTAQQVFDPAVPNGLPLFDPGVPKAIDQLAVSLPLPLDFSSLNVSYTHIEDADGETSQLLGVSYSQQVFKNISGYATAFMDIEDTDSFGVYAGLSMPLGERLSAATGASSGPGGTTFTAFAGQSEQPVDGSVGWQLRTSEGKVTQRGAQASYRSPWARFEAGIQQQEKEFRATAQMDGSLVATSGGVFAANRIDDSFAVVDVGVPGVEVQFQNRPIGNTNSRGKKLITGLNSYEPQTISIDPKNLPVDAAIPTTRQVIVPAGQTGIVLDFGVKEAPEAALVGLVDASGAPLEAGLTGRVGDSEFVVGYDGEAYMMGLQRSNTATVDLADGGSCNASFGYRPSKGQQVVIKGIRCE